MRKRGRHSAIAQNLQAQRPGFTLLEMATSVAVMSILMVGMGSVILVAGKALPDAERPTSKLIRTSELAGEIVAELQEARHIAERTANAITFTVADRDGDGSPERIRYAWSGMPGDPLTRRYNSGSVVNVLENIHVFDLDYDIQSVTEEYPGPPIESSESILTQYTAPGDSDFVITSQNWVGQCFHPGDFIPSDAKSWTITKVGFFAKSVGEDDGNVWVRLRRATAQGRPDMEQNGLSKSRMKESNLSLTYRWEEFAFTGSAVSNLSPGQGLCLVLDSGIDESAGISYAATGGSGLVETSDAGTSWTYQNNSSMRYTIWGTYIVPGPPQTAARQYVTGIHVSLQIGDDVTSRVDTATVMLNTPEVLSAYWELDFDTDPTALDMNGDGTEDWSDEYQEPFDPATLEGGIWYAPKRLWGNMPLLSTAPDEDFAELTTVDLRFRATSPNGRGTQFYIYVDRHDGLYAALYLTLLKPNDSSQELWVSDVLANGNNRVLKKYDVPVDFVNLRAVIDPGVDTIAVFVDGAHKETFTYFWGTSQSTFYNWGSYSEAAA